MHWAPGIVRHLNKVHLKLLKAFKCLVCHTRFQDPRMVEKHSRLKHSKEDIAKEEETISEPSAFEKTETTEDKKAVQVAITPEVGDETISANAEDKEIHAKDDNSAFKSVRSPLKNKEANKENEKREASASIARMAVQELKILQSKTNDLANVIKETRPSIARIAMRELVALKKKDAIIENNQKCVQEWLAKNTTNPVDLVKPNLIQVGPNPNPVKFQFKPDHIPVNPKVNLANPNINPVNLNLNPVNPVKPSLNPVKFQFKPASTSSTLRRVRKGLKMADENQLAQQAWLPDGHSRILRSNVFGPSGFCTMAPLRCKI